MLLSPLAVSRLFLKRSASHTPAHTPSLLSNPPRPKSEEPAPVPQSQTGRAGQCAPRRHRARCFSLPCPLWRLRPHSIASPAQTPPASRPHHCPRRSHFPPPSELPQQALVLPPTHP